MLPAEEPLALGMTTPSLSHPPSSQSRGRGRSPSGERWAGLRPRGRGGGRRAGGPGFALPLAVPVRGTSWSAPERAAPVRAPRSRCRRPNSDASKSVRCGRAPARPPSSPEPSVPVLDSPGPRPRASPLRFCQRGSPDSLPFPEVRNAGAPRRAAARGRAVGAHCGPRRRRLHNFFAGLGDPLVPLALPPDYCSLAAAGGGEASVWPGRHHARARGIGVRQGGTALNALDSPASALSPPSSPDSWGLCFLHPPRGARSAPTATRDSSSAAAAAAVALL